MKRGKRDTTRNIHVVSGFPLYISCYIAEIWIAFLTVHVCIFSFLLAVTVSEDHVVLRLPIKDSPNAMHSWHLCGLALSNLALVGPDTLYRPLMALMRLGTV